MMIESIPTGLQSIRQFQQFHLIDYQYAPNDQCPFHKDEHPKISILLGGQLKETVGRQEVWASPLSVVVKPPDAIHANQYGPKGTRIISIIGKNEYNWPECIDSDRLQRYGWFHGQPVAGAVVEWLSALSQSEKETDLESALIQLVAALTDDQPATGNSTPPQWLRRVAESLRDCCDQNIQIRELAQESNVHPVYLARIFRQYFNCNPKQYQQTFRMRRAIDQLTQNEALVQVALNNGFSDQSHFSRLFKSTTGISPGSFRKLVACL